MQFTEEIAMEDCPFCGNEVPNGAIVCGDCGAKKGYTHASGRVYGRGRTMCLGVLLPGAIAMIFAFAAAVSPIWRGGFLVAAAIFAIPVVQSIWRLKKGPVWLRRH